MQRQQRRLAAILAADMVGYSRLMEADESGTLARFNALRAELFEPKIAQFGGRVVGAAGDSLLVEFTSAVDAVQCAVETQARLAERNTDVPEDRRMVFRMGVNLGDVIAESDTIYGEGVNIASRLEKLADPGVVVIARSVHDQVKGKLPYTFTHLGEHHVKNIAEPVTVYRAEAARSGTTESDGRSAEAPALPDKPSIAVLAFTNMSGDPEQEYFSDGIAEDIITELCRFRSLFVIARNSSFAYKGRSVKVQELARDLGVRYIVEGSVRKAANRVRITAQLIEASTGRHVWAERYDRPLDDIFAVQDEIVVAIVRRLVRGLENEETERARYKPPMNLSAYEYYLRGRQEWFRRNYTEALGHLEKAVIRDPSCARALAMMAFCYAHSVFNMEPGWVGQEYRAKELAEKAISADNQDALVHGYVAWVNVLLGDFDAAEHHSERAVELNPHEPYAAHFRGAVLAAVGRAREGLEWLERALRFNPLGWAERWPELLFEALFSAGDYDRAIATFQRWRFPSTYEFLTLAACYAQLGQFREAQGAIQEYERRRPAHMDTAVVVASYLRSTKLEEVQDRWLDGVRKAGLAV